MVFSKTFKVSGQLVAVLAILFGINSVAHGANKSFKPTYKVERCDCLGFSEDIPTFLSDLAGGDMDIFGEGKTLKAAQNEAQKMCIESYRNFASVSQQEHPNNVIYSGCKKLQSTPDGDWKAI